MSRRSASIAALLLAVAAVGLWLYTAKVADDDMSLVCIISADDPTGCEQQHPGRWLATAMCASVLALCAVVWALVWAPRRAVAP